MGFSVAWVAVRGKDPAEVRAAFGVQALAPREVPAGRAPELIGLSLAGGWYLIIDSFFRELHASPERVLPRLSRGAEAIVCRNVDSTDYCDAEGWRDGKLIWFVANDAGAAELPWFAWLTTWPWHWGQLGSGRLIQGRPPARYGELQGKADAPVDLAQEIVGFRHDEMPPWSSAHEELVVTDASPHAIR